MNVHVSTGKDYTSKFLMSTLLLLVSLLVLLNLSFGAPANVFVNTYVDHVVVISTSGASSIIGSSNTMVSQIVPANSTLSFETNSLTSKKGDYWTFNYETTYPVNVSLIKVQLPKNAVVNYVHSPANTFIEGSDSVLLTFTDMNNPINITVQYSFKNAPSTGGDLFKTQNQLYAIIALSCALFIVLFGVTALIIRRMRRNPSTTKIQSLVSGINVQKLNTIKLTLNETQIKIIDALLAREGKTSQNAIAHHTQIPKASLSRNVDLLVQKQILVKHANGYTNQLVFHESLRN